MNPYRLSQDCWLLENAIYIPSEKTLVIADLQLGAEQQLRALGHNVMYEQAEKMLRLLERLVAEHDVERLVINGDLKHEFGRISGQERRDILGMLRKLKRSVRVEVVRGNHDTITKPLTDRLGIELHEALSVGPFYCVHGHELPAGEAFQRAETVIIGHMHPAIVLHDGVRKEKCKCFLVGAYGGKRLIVLPSFATLSEGADVLRVDPNTPLLDRNAMQDCELYAIADEIRRFGTVRELARTLALL